MGICQVLIQKQGQEQVFYETPSGNGSKNSIVVILVDCSGSMSGNRWKYLEPQTNRLINTVGKKRVILLTCGDNGKVVPDKELRADQSYHSSTLECGSGTNFMNGLRALEAAVASEGASDKPLKLVFITDGQDAMTMEMMQANLQGSKISSKPINFFSVGISSAYPTKYANMFRVFYHTGSATPELFHVSDEKNQRMYKEKYDLLIPYLTAEDEDWVMVDPPQFEYPFSSSKTKFLPTNHIFVSTEVSLGIDSRPHSGQKNLAPEQVQKLTSQFHTSIVSDGANKDFAKESAKKANACEVVIKVAVKNMIKTEPSLKLEKISLSIDLMTQNIVKIRDRKLNLRNMTDSELAKIMEAATIPNEPQPIIYEPKSQIEFERS